MKIGFIGLGNMARAIIGGITSKGGIEPKDIYGSDISTAAADEAALTYLINTGTSNSTVAEEADILFLAVKPQFMDEALRTFKDDVRKDCIVVSIAPGKTLDYFAENLGRKVKVVRCMPNTPALIGEGCTGCCKNEYVTDEDMAKVMKLLKSFGRAIEVPESQMDAVVGVSGSAPAYVFMFIEAMADEAVAAGMPRNKAYEFAAQAVMGSAKMVLETGKHPGELKDMVCSPGGTTIQAVKVLEEKNFRGTVMDAIEACINKSKSL